MTNIDILVQYVDILIDQILDQLISLSAWKKLFPSLSYNM